MCRWLFTVGAWGWRRLLDRTAALLDRRYPGACFAKAVAGDGLVPVGSACLQGFLGPRWYGTPEVVAQWWCD